MVVSYALLVSPPSLILHTFSQALSLSTANSKISIFNSYRSINQPNDVGLYCTTNVCIQQWQWCCSSTVCCDCLLDVESIWMVWSCHRRARRMITWAGRRNWGLNEWSGGGGQEGTRQYFCPSRLQKSSNKSATGPKVFRKNWRSIQCFYWLTNEWASTIL